MTGSRLIGNVQGRRALKGVSTDSRSLKKGEAFVALIGETFDGHRFIGNVIERGAAVAVVAASKIRSLKRFASSVPLIAVPDTLVAYGQIATMHRRRFDIPVIAVAGSNGKTSTKELVADVLAETYCVLRTEGNLNNLIGVPATMLRLTAEHTAAVIEIGTNTPGEIDALCGILEPTHGLITNIGREHLELLGSLDGVATEEGALFRYLERTGGTAFVNLDDKRVAGLSRGVDNRVTYGTSARSMVRGQVEGLDKFGSPLLSVSDSRKDNQRVLDVQLKTPGTHTAGNALAAAAVGLTMKVSRTAIKRALRNFTPRIYSHGYARLAPMSAANGAVVLNDTYNANPDSVSVGLKTIAAIKIAPGGRRIVVLGDMLELGKSSVQEHEAIGREIAAMPSIHIALFLGKAMKNACRTMTAALRSRKRLAMFFEDNDDLIGALLALITPDDVVLVKGSRSMKMETVVMALTGKS